MLVGTYRTFSNQDLDGRGETGHHRAISRHILYEVACLYLSAEEGALKVRICAASLVGLRARPINELCWAFPTCESLCLGWGEGEGRVVTGQQQTMSSVVTLM